MNNKIKSHESLLQSTSNGNFLKNALHKHFICILLEIRDRKHRTQRIESTDNRPFLNVVYKKMRLAISIRTVLVADSVLVLISREFDHISNFFMFLDECFHVLIVGQFVWRRCLFVLLYYFGKHALNLFVFVESSLLHLRAAWKIKNWYRYVGSSSERLGRFS